jgi:hypothetical protein
LSEDVSKDATVERLAQVVTIKIMIILEQITFLFFTSRIQDYSELYKLPIS